ncbi:hypothetical protein Dimus_013339 [Dionaea muscipula]
MEYKVGKEATRYYTFIAKRNHCIAIPRSIVHSWKQKFVRVTSRTFSEAIQPNEVTLDPKPEVFPCLNSQEKSLYKSFKSSGKHPYLSWHVLIQLETLEEHGLAVVKHPSMSSCVGRDEGDIWICGRFIFSVGARSKEGNTGGGIGSGGRVVCHSGRGDAGGANRSLSGNEKAEVVIRTNRRGETREKGQEPIEGEREKDTEKEERSESAALLMDHRRGSKREVKEVVTKTQAMYGDEQVLSGREQAETGWKPGAEDTDPFIIKDVMEVLERDKSSMASQAEVTALPQQRQKLPMATVEEKRMKGAATVT